MRVESLKKLCDKIQIAYMIRRKIDLEEVEWV